jgi:hypothetical protein
MSLSTVLDSAASHRTDVSKMELVLREPVYKTFRSRIGRRLAGTVVYRRIRVGERREVVEECRRAVRFKDLKHVFPLCARFRL